MRTLATDSHAHLYWDGLREDLDALVERARAAGIGRFVVVGTDLAKSRAAFELCRGRAEMFPTAGIHPHDAADVDERALAELAEMCARPECVAVGETGLDYFKEFSPRAAQRPAFLAQARLARELDKALVVHCRDAHDDTVAVLREAGVRRGVMHCYTMGPDELPPYLEQGFHISFSGVVTYPKNEANRAAAALVPDDRLLVETDCPFLAPQGHRGKQNEPAFMAATIEALARVRGVDRETIARTTSANATRLFGLPASR